MEYIQQILFAVVLGITGWLVYQRIKIIRDTIQLGRAEDRSDRPGERLGMMLRIAFGQKKMFDRPLVGVMPVSYTHLDVYKRQVLPRSANSPISFREELDIIFPFKWLDKPFNPFIFVMSIIF